MPRLSTVAPPPAAPASSEPTSTDPARSSVEPETPEETTLVVRPDLQALARAEFTRFYLLSYPELRLVLTALLGDSARVRRATAEAYARAWVRWPTVRRLEDTPAWLRETAARAYGSPRRRLTPRWASRRVPGPTGEAPALDRTVLDGLRRLPETQRRALVLHYLAGLPVDRIAREDGTSVESVRVRLAHGQLALGLRLGTGRVARALRDGRRSLPPARHAPAPPVASVFRLARRWQWTGRAATGAVAAVGVAAALVALAQSFGPVTAAIRPAELLVPITNPGLSGPAAPRTPPNPDANLSGPRTPLHPKSLPPGSAGRAPVPGGSAGRAPVPPGSAGRAPGSAGRAPVPPGSAGRAPVPPGRDPRSAVPGPPGHPGAAIRSAAAPTWPDRPEPAPREEHQTEPYLRAADRPGPMWPWPGRGASGESGPW